MSWFRKSPAIDHQPAFIKDYRQLDFGIPSRTPIRQLTFVVVDTELTGLTRADTMVSLGAVKVADNEIVVGEGLELRFAQATGNQQSEIHGELGHQQLLSGDQLLRSWLQYTQNHVIVGHQPEIDLQMINEQLKAHFGGLTMHNKVLDTLALVQRLDPTRAEQGKSFQLDQLCKEYDIPISNRHTALGDAYMTALLLMKLLHRLELRGITTAGDIFRKRWGIW